MKRDQSQNGNGGEDVSDVFDDMTIGELAKILLEESNNNKREILEQMSAMEVRLLGRKDKLEAEHQNLRMEVHQNQTTFMHNHKKIEKRVEALEGKAA